MRTIFSQQYCKQRQKICLPEYPHCRLSSRLLYLPLTLKIWAPIQLSSLARIIDLWKCTVIWHLCLENFWSLIRWEQAKYFLLVKYEINTFRSISIDKITDSLNNPPGRPERLRPTKRYRTKESNRIQRSPKRQHHLKQK